MIENPFQNTLQDIRTTFQGVNGGLIAIAIIVMVYMVSKRRI